MVWECFFVVFKAMSPVHIGYRQIGALKTTRYYITGRALWGAITNNLTRNLFERPLRDNYEEIGEIVRDYIRTSYFYPAISESELGTKEEWEDFKVNGFYVFIPKYTSDGIKIGPYHKEEFEQIFVRSFVSTAIDPRTRTSEEAGLHELEFINNKVIIDGKKLNVYWLGYLFVDLFDSKVLKNYEVSIKNEDNINILIIIEKNEKFEARLRESIDQLFVGGERNYGLGRLKQKEFLKIQKENYKIFNKFNIKLDNKDPIIEDIDFAISHIELTNTNILEEGEIEPIVGLEWSKKGSGQSVSDPIICIKTGSKIKKSNAYINHYGILKYLQ